MSENDFEKMTKSILASLKTEKKTDVPSIQKALLPNKHSLLMYVITEKILKSRKVIALLADWRKKSNIWFPAQFPVTFEGTKKWSEEQLLHKKDRILFFLKIKEAKQPFGHIGLYRFNFKERSCEIDNVIRGKESRKTKGGMSIGLQLLIDWTFKYLLIRRLYLKVFSDNQRALRFYDRLGFLELDRTPLVEKRENNVISWIETEKNSKNIKRYFVRMYLDNKKR